MTEERLEELIKQGATIWSTGFNEEIKLNPKNCKIEKQKWLTELKPKLYLVIKEDEEHYPTYCLENLREDVDRAKWECKMHAERTERFEPPMWDDLQEYEFCFIYNQEIFNLSVTRYSVSIIVGHEAVDFSAELTKENYEKACEIVRDLFGGTK